MALCKYESRIVVPTGGWVFTLEEFGPDGGPFMVTITAGNYYLSSVAPGGTRSLRDEIAFQMNAGTSVGTYSADLDDDTDAGTGKITLTQFGVTTFSVTWGTATDLRDLLGYAANLSGAAAYLSPSQARRLWLAGCPRSGNRAPDGSAGYPVSDATFTQAPGGSAKSLQYAERKEDTIEHTQIRGSRAWNQEDVITNEAWEQFWRDAVKTGHPTRYYLDRSSDATYLTYSWTEQAMARINLEPVDPQWRNGPMALWSLRADVVEFV